MPDKFNKNTKDKNDNRTQRQENLDSKNPQSTAEFPLRLQVYLARCGIASRRASEAYIIAGRVSVNGEQVTELGTKVEKNDIVFVDGKKIQLEENKRYVLLHKPAGFVCSAKDEKGRQSALDLLKPHFSERLFTIGRLDMFSSGLLLLTNDGEFAAKLSHPSSGIEKEYIVVATSPFPKELPASFTKGLRIDDVFYKAKEAELQNPFTMRVVLVEGKNREIRRVCDYFEVIIKRLVRTKIAFLTLDGLDVGSFRELNSAELAQLSI